MILSIAQTAELLRKTRRQVMYMIRQGKIPARKVGGRWRVEQSDLRPESESEPAQSQRAAIQSAHLRAAVEEALEPTVKTGGYTFANLRAVQIAGPICTALAERGAGFEDAAQRMRECLDQLALGCHRFDQAEKSAAYRHGRDCASLAAMALWLHSRDGEDKLQRAIEQDLMPMFAGLLRRSDRKARRD